MDRSTWIFEQERHFLALRKSYFQFERLQTYQEPGNPSYDAFAAGDHGRARLIAHEAAAQEEEDLRRVCHKGVPYTRVHAIERPLTPYLRWEFAIYQVLARYGQRVLLVELDARSPREFVDSYDFLLFDYEFVMVQDYGQDGLLCGGWTTGDPALVARFAQLARDLTRAAIPLAEFERRYAHDLQPPA
ncbi:MAG: hypothetical protein KIT58_21640 [Planctomycetota bacterium]|nr:hypothetical protein [Planctomycetota bacterium]